jgi:dTDP-4-amino-4,6-dideoxygalactose transaminase
MTEYLTTGKPFIVGKELYYIAQAVLGGWLQGDGKFTRLCHQWLEHNLQCQKALLTHSCTGALEMAALLANIQAGDEVIMPSYTFSSTANAFVLRGAIPVFIDIKPQDMNIDESLIVSAITAKTRAIVAVHYAGAACQMDKICAIANSYGLIVIEDAAQAILTQFQGKALGTWGDFGCLSFHESKNVISGEGGALLVNRPEYVERAEIIREKGTNRSQFFRAEVAKYTWMDVGSSYLPSELIAAFLYAQLENAELIINHRRDLADQYYSGLLTLAEQGIIQLPDRAHQHDGNGHVVFFLARDETERHQFIHFLHSCQIGAAFHYIPLHSSPAGQRFGRCGSTMQVTDTIAARLVRLPISFGMNKDSVDRVLNAVLEFYRLQQ